MKPGAYELAADPQVLAALKAPAEPLRFTLRPGAAGVAAWGLELCLTPKP